MSTKQPASGLNFALFFGGVLMVWANSHSWWAMLGVLIASSRFTTTSYNY